MTRQLPTCLAPARSIATGFLPPHNPVPGDDAQDPNGLPSPISAGTVRDVVRCATAAKRSAHPALPLAVGLRGHGRSYRHLGRQAPTAKRQRSLFHCLPAPTVHGNGLFSNGSAPLRRHRSPPPSTRLWTPFSPQPSMIHLGGEAISRRQVLARFCEWRCICSGRFDDKRSLRRQAGARANEQTEPGISTTSARKQAPAQQVH